MITVEVDGGEGVVDGARGAFGHGLLFGAFSGEFRIRAARLLQRQQRSKK
jgi:hypothetical protein